MRPRAPQPSSRFAWFGFSAMPAQSASPAARSAASPTANASQARSAAGSSELLAFRYAGWVRPNPEIPMETLDVVIVGAGLSGIGAACHLEEHCPDRHLCDPRDAATQSAEPGISSAIPASDPTADMHTLGFRFKPWKDRKAIADGPVDPALRERVRGRVRRATPHPVRSRGCGGRVLVERGPDAGTSRSSARGRRSARADRLPLPDDVRGLLQLRPRAPTGLRGHGRLRGHGSSTRSSGPRTSTTPASASP